MHFSRIRRPHFTIFILSFAVSVQMKGADWNCVPECESQLPQEALRLFEKHPNGCFYIFDPEKTVLPHSRTRRLLVWSENEISDIVS